VRELDVVGYKVKTYLAKEKSRDKLLSCNR
jgi:hypothetical protein